MSVLDPTVKPSKWYEPVTAVFCNKARTDGKLCGRSARAVEHDPTIGYTGVNRCFNHLPEHTRIHRKD